MIAIYAVIVWFSAMFLLVGSFAAIIMAKIGAAGINKISEIIGISAYTGEKIITINWTAFGIMFTKFLF